ncbi:hypothetical protein KBB05_01895 [Patescibacteria group bacterium]|nr:hypothetical protein [Patescibacteria group bacterium]
MKYPLSFSSQQLVQSLELLPLGEYLVQEYKFDHIDHDGGTAKGDKRKGESGGGHTIGIDGNVDTRLEDNQAQESYSYSPEIVIPDTTYTTQGIPCQPYISAYQ